VTSGDDNKSGLQELLTMIHGAAPKSKAAYQEIQT